MGGGQQGHPLRLPSAAAGLPAPEVSCAQPRCRSAGKGCGPGARSRAPWDFLETRPVQLGQEEGPGSRRQVGEALSLHAVFREGFVQGFRVFSRLQGGGGSSSQGTHHWCEQTGNTGGWFSAGQGQSSTSGETEQGPSGTRKLSPVPPVSQLGAGRAPSATLPRCKALQGCPA